ncbi:MAG TPA: GNAT family N-acetyltransferase [Oligoflexia bacterium]|nr:GNAT family N-acetyltransferase [Oligoflexia bacterium]
MRVRKAVENELNEVFLMGYDAWGASLPIDMYLDSCAASYKYKQGEFYILENEAGKLLSSCIVYPLMKFGGIVSECAVGIGSLVTAPEDRHKGYATALLAALMGTLEERGIDAFFIHSDIPTKIYEKLGFYAAPEDMRDRGRGVTPMLRLRGGKEVSHELWREIVLPAYF